MKATLRNHPKVKFGGRRSWPHTGGNWHGAYVANTQFPSGEQGTLKDSRVEPDGLSITITIEYRRNVFSDILQVDDVTVLPKLNLFLQSHRDEELSVIGNLEVDLCASTATVSAGKNNENETHQIHEASQVGRPAPSDNRGC
jgi:hypothetical protein